MRDTLYVNLEVRVYVTYMRAHLELASNLTVRTRKTGHVGVNPSGFLFGQRRVPIEMTETESSELISMM